MHCKVLSAWGIINALICWTSFSWLLSLPLIPTLYCSNRIMMSRQRTLDLEQNPRCWTLVWEEVVIRFKSCKNVFIQAQGGVYTFRTTIYLLGKKLVLGALSWIQLKCWAEREFFQTSYSQVKSLQTSGIYGINCVSVIIRFIILSYRYSELFWA